MTTLRATKMARLFWIIGLMVIMAGCASQPAPKSEAESPPSMKYAAITDISTAQTAEATEVTVEADGPMTFSSFKQLDPLAVVLYIPQTTAGQFEGNTSSDSPIIKGILTKDQQGAGSPTTRVEIQLADDVTYTARQADKEILLTFSHNAKPMERASVSQASQQLQQPAPVQQSAPAVVATASAPKAAPANPPASEPMAPKPVSTVKSQNGLAWVNKVEFLNEEEGRSTLIVGTTQAVDYRIDKVGPQKLEVKLANTRIPSYRQRPLITTRFPSAVNRITPYQRAKESSESFISIEMRESVPYVAEQTDNLLMIHFEASSIPPKPLEQAQLPAWKQAMAAEPISPVAMAVEPMAAPPSVTRTDYDTAQLEDQLIKEDIEIRALLAPQRRKYTGEKIALDFYDTDIKNVFRILREVSGKNFAIDKDVTGKVTMTLDKPVPWDQVLDLVLRMNQLGMTHEGEIVRIATLATLKTEDDLRKAKLEALRKAREDAKALQPMITRYIPVSYSDAESEVKPHIEKIITPERGTVTVDVKNNQVIITDTVAKVRQAENIIKRIDKVTSQVIIEARVVEVSNNFSKELGLTWDMGYGPGVIPGLEWATSTDMAMNFPAPGADSSFGINFSRLSGVPFVLNARLNALETTGEGKILSAPKILTLDNKKASIKQGVEYPYQERDSAGGSSVKFKNIDLLLEVTPHVTPDNRISLILFITKNDVAGVTAGVPAVATNEAQTELLVNDGDTVVIGGIIKSTANKGKSAFPGLHRIPILGWLFQNNTDTEQSNELLIFITPRIVQLEQELAQTK